ncbi:glycosyltransferase family 1 protein [Pedobacter sp. SYP-B3415]|uniref:glycosyltransferase family 4 protein n=1 Tax=Pedobacter sp. SYP-B3415 TaxID=2496641 RepID=UPI001F0F3396|nr:glycosyltransferase family 1 protein [Pedobacter sp. SYP-B3415]
METRPDSYHFTESSAPATGAELSGFNSLIIGYDGKRAANNTTGLGNYSRWLISVLAKNFPANKYLVYTNRRSDNDAVTRFLAQHNIVLKLPGSKSLFWRSFGIIRDLIRDRVQVFHGLSHEIPFGINKTRIRTVVTIHDLIFLRFPEWYKPVDRLIYKLKSRYACQHADKIIAISERTKADIVSFYHVDPSRVEVIYQSCDPVFKNRLKESHLSAIRSRYQLPARYILNVGTIETRKNLLLAVEALPAIDADVHLVVVGKKTTYFKEVEAAVTRLRLSSRVHFLPRVPFSDLPGIYQAAELFVYPSRYEGFGIPLVEALHSEIPVVAATGSCLEEAGGPESIYVSPDDPQALAAAVNKIVANEDIRQQMVAAGAAYVQRFEDDLLASQLMNCYLNMSDHANTRD